MGEGRDSRIARDTSPLLLAGAILALGMLLQFTDGNVPPGFMRSAMGALGVAGILAVGGSLGWRLRVLDQISDAAISRWLAFTLLVQLAFFAIKPPALSLPVDDQSWILPFSFGLVDVVVLTWLALRKWARFGRAIVPVALLVFVALGVWTIRRTPNPGIDVFVFQREAIAALSRGESPYAITMPMVYGNMDYYGQGLVENGRLLIGLPYPPLSLLLQWPFERLLGDFRYALIAALAVAAWLCSRVRRDAIGAFAVLLLLFTPRSFFVVEQSWTEPFVVLALACVAYAAVRRPAWLAPALGALFAMKQYTIFMAPIAFLLVPTWPAGRTVRLIVAAIAIAIGITLPFALWNWPGFYRSAIEFQFLQPFRPDSLSYLAWYARITGSQLPSSLGFVTMAIAMGIVAWKAPRTPAGFAAGGAVMLFALFAFGKQAFCNYYFVVLGALAISLSVRGSDAVDGAPGLQTRGLP